MDLHSRQEVTKEVFVDPSCSPGGINAFKTTCSSEDLMCTSVTISQDEEKYYRVHLKHLLLLYSNITQVTSVQCHPLLDRLTSDVFIHQVELIGTHVTKVEDCGGLVHAINSFECAGQEKEFTMKIHAYDYPAVDRCVKLGGEKRIKFC